MGDVVKVGQPTRAQLIEHLAREHPQAFPAKARRLPKPELKDLHRLIHFGLGR